MNLSNLTQNGLKLLSTQYLGLSIGFLISIIAARLLGPDDFGLAALILAYPGLIANFVEFKSSDITTRYIVKFDSEENQEGIGAICKLGYIIDLVGGILAFLIIFSLVLLGGIKMDYQNFAILILSFSFSNIIYSTRRTSRAILISFKAFNSLSVLYVLDKVVLLVAIGLCYWFGFNIDAYIIAICSSNIISSFIYFLLARVNLIRRDVSLFFSSIVLLHSIKDELKSLFGYNYLTLSVSGAISQLPVLLLGELSSEREAGYYKLASTFMGFGKSISSSLANSTYANIAERWSSREFRLLRDNLLKWSKKEGLSFSILIIVGMILLPVIIPALYGAEYKPTVLGCQVLFVGILIKTILFWSDSFYYVFGFLKVLLTFLFIYLLIIFIGGLYFSSEYGFLGMSIIFMFATVIHIFFTSIYAINYLRKQITH